MKSLPRRTEKSARIQNMIFSFNMTTPTVVLLLIMSVFPLLFTLYYSFTDYNYLAKSSLHFVGLNNYIKLFKNKYFVQAVFNTVKFTVICVFMEMFLGLVVAVFVNSITYGKKLLRTIVILPYLIPPVTVALIWQILLSNNYGIINRLFNILKIPTYNWFYDIKIAFWTICFIEVWQCMPFVFLLLYASLQSIPEDLFEAAKLDGANSWEQFKNITLPGISNSLFLCFLMRTVDTFRLFDKINILTKGGPANSTATITQYLYNNGISNLHFGNGSAIAIVMVVIVLLLSSTYIRRSIANK